MANLVRTKQRGCNSLFE